MFLFSGRKNDKFHTPSLDDAIEILQWPISLQVNFAGAIFRIKERQ
jgi:hypothetical protein|tara:strand:- start:17084 stop:17221 length:138 start_codon:yes stop_codon:yes gene_type:complete